MSDREPEKPASTSTEILPGLHMLGPFHILADIKCPNCGSPPSDHEVRNYDPTWRDGDVYCTKCGVKVRNYDAG